MSNDSTEGDIIRRIVKKAGIPQIVDALVSKLSWSDLQSLMLHVYRARASTLRAADVLRQYRSNRFVQIANVSPSEVMEFDSMAFAALPAGFQQVELSPLSPLGTCSALAPVDQNNAITTIRNTEVLSDPTNGMALECARRRKSGNGAGSREVKLCCSHRIVRAQLFKGPVSYPHFRMLSLCSSGRDSGNHEFERNAAIEHIDYFLRLMKSASAAGFAIKDIRVKLIVLSENIRHIVDTAITRELEERHQDAVFEVETRAENPGNYYSTMRFQLFASNQEGEEFFLVDGGLTQWTQKLLNDKKERFMTSGMGTERFLVGFQQKEIPPRGQCWLRRS